MRKRRKFSVDEWCKEVKPRAAGLPCRLCSAPKDVAEALNRIIELRKAKKLPASQAQIVEMLLAEFDFKTNESSLMRHFKQHKGIPW